MTDQPQSPLEWYRQDRDLIAQADYGLWRINPYDVGRLSLQPNLPGTTKLLPGEVRPEDRPRYAAAFDEYMAHPGKDERTEEYQRLGHVFGIGLNPEPMFGETVEETRMLAEAMHAGDADLAPATEQLAAAGFAPKYPDHEDERLRRLWSIRIRSGSLDVTLDDEPGRRSLYVRFHGDRARFWHNVAEVAVVRTGRSGTVLHYAHAPQARDPLRVGAAHVIDVMRRRLERGGRFSTPLGKVLRTR